MRYDPHKSVWLNPNIEYLFNNEIIEYDITDAGFSLIKQYQLLSESKIKELASIPKGFDRHKAIGIIQGKDKAFSKALLDKFTEVRSIFLGMNKLTDNDLISVKKDAIFTIGECTKLKFGSVQFIPKNRYSSYIRFANISNLEIYYSDDTTDIKGMGTSAINRHRLYMIYFIRRIISLIESNNTSVKRIMLKFIDDYKQHNLDDEYYIEFNNKSRDYNAPFNYQNLLVPIVQIIIREVG